MSNYFRITAYHPAKNICAIFDSNGRFEKLWQFSSYLVQKASRLSKSARTINSSTGTSQRLLRAHSCLYGLAGEVSRTERETPSRYKAKAMR